VLQGALKAIRWTDKREQRDETEDSESDNDDDPRGLSNKEVFTLPQVFLADPRGMTRNDTESVWIHADSEQGVELNFTWVLAFPVHADPHRSAWIPSENHTDTRNVLGQFRVKIYLHRLGLVLFCAVSV
jgi:hypothetical protein